MHSVGARAAAAVVPPAAAAVPREAQAGAVARVATREAWARVRVLLWEVVEVEEDAGRASR